MSQRGSSRKAAVGGRPKLPPKFTEIRSIIGEQVSPGSFVNVVGVVKDWQMPLKTCRFFYLSSFFFFSPFIISRPSLYVCHYLMSETTWIATTSLTAPFAAKDYKSSMTLYDLSTQEDNESVKLDIFRAHEEDMPAVGPGDVVLAYNARVSWLVYTCPLL